MIACAVHPDAANRRVVALSQFLEKLGYTPVHAISLEAAADETMFPSGHDNNIVLVPTTEEWRPAASDIIALASKVAGRAFVIFVCDDIRLDDYKALLRTGVGDCIAWKHAPQEIFEISRRLRGEASLAPDGAKKDVSKHVIVGFLPAGGGVGNTTLALEAGVRLAMQKGKDARRPAAVELDFNHRAICEYVDLAPRLDMAELARDPQRLDNYMLDIFRSQHPSGLDLYSSVEPPADCAAIDGAVVFALLGKLHDRYNPLLLDFPDYRTPWIDDALRNCDFVVVTGRNSVPSIRQMARELKRLRELKFDPSRMAAAVTHCEINLLGVVTNKASTEAALAGHRVFFIRDDRSFALEAVNSGASMTQTRAERGICKDIRAVAEALRTLAPRDIT